MLPRGWLRWLCALALLFTASAARSPVIIIPGFSSSALEARIDAQSAPAALKAECPELVGDKWVQIWRGNSSKACQARVLRLDVDLTTGRYANTTGTQVRPIDFGGLRGVDSGGGDPVKGFWGPMIASLQGAGYQLGQNIYGAPYDWRLSPSDGLTQVHWYADLSALVERAVAQAGGMPATLVCHSMGTQVAHYFLSNVTTAPWRTAHISGFFAMGPVLGGAETALSLSLPGIVPGLAQLPPSAGDTWNAQQTWPAGAYLAPRPYAFQARVIAEVGSNYTARQIERMLLNLGQTLPAALYRRVAATFPEPLRVMDVRVACVYGTGLPTPELVVHSPVPGDSASEALAAAPAPYLVGAAPAPAPTAGRRLLAVGVPAPAPGPLSAVAAANASLYTGWTASFGDGDGVVNLVSLRTCERLVAEAVVRRPNVSHNQIVSDTEALAMLLRFAARATVPAAAPAPSPASLVSAI